MWHPAGATLEYSQKGRGPSGAQKNLGTPGDTKKLGRTVSTKKFASREKHETLLKKRTKTPELGITRARAGAPREKSATIRFTASHTSNAHRERPDLEPQLHRFASNTPRCVDSEKLYRKEDHVYTHAGDARLIRCSTCCLHMASEYIMSSTARELPNNCMASLCASGTHSFLGLPTRLA